MKQSVNAIKMLSVDMINRANSGHPGICLGAADAMYALWNKEINVNPKKANWINRDRFVLSAGHGSAMLYSTLHLSGFNVKMNDLKQFRQIHSKTPGHPELGYTDGVDATTGPLGQGIAMAVGMAISEAHLAAKYNKKGLKVFDHYTFALCGDGDLMEGVASEAASLAGHLNLNKLILLYDSNDISLDGPLNYSYSEKTLNRFKAYQWNTIVVKQGNDIKEVQKAIKLAKKNKNGPTIIELKTVIGEGTKVAGTSSAHGAPIGHEERNQLAKKLNWQNAPFKIEDKVYNDFKNNIAKRGEKAFKDWEQIVKKYAKNYPEAYIQLKKVLNNEAVDYKVTKHNEKSIATRVASQEAINEIAKQVDNLIGGSADLIKSNNTNIPTSDRMTKNDYASQNIYYGVREFAMSGISAGIAAHGGLKTFCSTFFVFSDYLKASIRLAAIMKLPVTYIFTHDSVMVGEDGPTHEPVEQLAGLRAMPNLNVIRPADQNETEFAWKMALASSETPTALILSRQNINNLNEKTMTYANFKKGAYVLCEDKGFKQIIIATGSEVELAMLVKSELNKKGHKVRIISMPSMHIFDKQSQKYKDTILPPTITNRSVIEMAASFGWHKYIGLNGLTFTIDTFGESGEGSMIKKHFKFEVPHIAKVINNVFK